VDDLTAFLNARYGEAEALAREAGGGEWRTACICDGECLGLRSGCEVVEGDDIQIYAEGGHDAFQARYIAASAPAHRLRDIALKRAILALHAAETRREQRRALADDIAAGKPLWWYEVVHSCVICGWFDSETGGCATVRQLGAEYGTHPQYRQVWAP
jgi:hypothetical protein